MATKKRTIFLKVVMLGFMVSMFIFFFTNNYAQAKTKTVNLKVASYGAPNSSDKVIMNEVLKDIELMTEGRVKGKQFVDSLLGPLEMLDGCQRGLADIVTVNHGYFSFKNLPFMNIGVQPFLYEGKAGAIKAWTHEDSLDKLCTEYLNANKYDNVIQLSSWYIGMHSWCFAKGQPKTPKDFQALKVRTAGHLSDILRKYFQINVVSMPPTEIYEALQRGMVDGSMASLGNWVEWGWMNVAKWCLDIEWHPITMSIIMNKKTFNKLSKVDQEIVKSSMIRVGRSVSLDDMRKDIEYYQIMRENGVTIYKPNKEEMAQWDAPAKNYLKDWKEVVGGDWVDRAIDIIGKYNKNAAGIKALK
jgi:TRAP-type C4-dicarboxylate transport system substrate-binding protein